LEEDLRVDQEKWANYTEEFRDRYPDVCYGHGNWLTIIDKAKKKKKKNSSPNQNIFFS